MKQGLWGNRVIGRDPAGVPDGSPGADKETSHEVKLYPKGTLMSLFVDACPKAMDNSGNSMKKRGGRRRKRQREEDYLVVPTLASFLPPRGTIQESMIVEEQGT